MAGPAKALSVDVLWQIARVGAVDLAPDGRHAVCTLTEQDPQGSAVTSLWLLPTDRCAPRRLSWCGQRDGQPAFSPQGDRIAFVARREQQGHKDATPQLYLIPTEGGEARRVSDFAPGVESFKWMPDGRRIVFAAWVWPGLKGGAAQARAHQRFSQRKASGYVTSAAYYRHWDHAVPMGRVLHLLLLDLASGRVRDLFEGTAFELPRHAPGAVDYEVHPAGRRIVFVHDPQTEPRAGNRRALAEVDLGRRRIAAFLDDSDWDFAAPRFSPDGTTLAATAAHVAQAHNAPSQLALIDGSAPRGRRRGTDHEGGREWRVLGADWDHEVDAPLRFSPDGSALLFSAEQRGRCHLWRCDLASERFEIAHPGGWVQGFAVAGQALLVAADSACHPVRLSLRRGSAAPQRLERFNDARLASVAFGEVREVSLQGALGDAVQMWLSFPPGFDARRRHPVLQVIHGGPHAAAGDTFSYRWNPHVFAAAGPVVAQVNYHGSSGFGFAFKRSLVGRQGELELQDIEAGTDWLLAQPWADAQRVCASGGSYGGFLVAWMNGHVPPGRYQAYVCHAGVFDRVATFSADSYATRPKDLAANYWEDLPRVLAQSPHAFAAAMRTPTLVIHGAQDFRVPDCNGLAYYNTLKARGVEARLLWFPDENHWVLSAANSKLWYAEFMAWIAAHAGPAPQAGEAPARVHPLARMRSPA
jgi:dipeptidyl aminopeptidase/acylaminoacyl peptidase